MSGELQVPEEGPLKSAKRELLEAGELDLLDQVNQVSFCHPFIVFDMPDEAHGTGVLVVASTASHEEDGKDTGFAAFDAYEAFYGERCRWNDESAVLWNKAMQRRLKLTRPKHRPEWPRPESAEMQALEKKLVQEGIRIPYNNSSNSADISLAISPLQFDRMMSFSFTEPEVADYRMTVRGLLARVERYNARGLAFGSIEPGKIVKGLYEAAKKDGLDAERQFLYGAWEAMQQISDMLDTQEVIHESEGFAKGINVTAGAFGTRILENIGTILVAYERREHHQGIVQVEAETQSAPEKQIAIRALKQIWQLLRS